MKQVPQIRIWLASGRATVLVLTFFALAAAVLSGSLFATAATTPTPLAISQVPLQLATPIHPQVLIAIGNSESMDGNLSGAIMTGSGSLGSSLSTLNASSSPTTYTVPTGFTPPVTAATAGSAPYTSTVGVNLVDNSPSRLNVAKAGVAAILNAYMANTDFALVDYSTSGTSKYTTWVYHMSTGSGSSGAFTFTNTAIAQSGSAPYTVANPCYGYTTATSATVKSNCSNIASTLYTSSTLNSNQYMVVAASSDNPSVNDVLYASGQPAVFVNYGGATMYNSTLSGYNNGQVQSSYNYSVPNANTTTGPTNAGYVPATPQVMYVERGFGYGGNQSSSTGNVVVGMTTAGTSPTTATVATAIAKFTPYLQPETNNASTTEIKASAGQSPTAGLLAKAKTTLASSLGSAACSPKQYVVLISDGLPTQDLSGKNWPPLGSAAATTYGVSATFNSDGSLNTTNDQALTDAITNITALKNAGINTYVIGLGAGVDPSLNPQAAATLTAMAVAGGTSNAYPATSPAALVNALNSILVSIQAGSFSTSQSAVNSTHLKTGSVQYQASFNSNDTPYQDWTGDMRETALNPSGNPVGTPIWSAQSMLDAQVAATGGWSSGAWPGRSIVTWNPTLNSGAGGGAPFETANLSSTQLSQLGSTAAQQTATLQYLRGSQANELHNGGTLRNRSHILGDIVDSTPQYIGAPAGPYFVASYANFMATQAARQPMLYVGANDGMLHAFNASTGSEQFAFVPNGVFSKLSQLTAPLYNQGHQFYVDGSPQTADVQFSDSTWHTLLVGGENGGGNSVYALDVTNPASLTTEAAVSSAVLWEFTDANMGLSYSEPQIAKVNVTGSPFAVFFGNGYNSPGQTPYLYAVNPQTGAKLAGINLCAAVITALPSACNASLPNGLSSVAIANSDGLLGSAITQVYAGDLQGNLWVVDVSNATPSAWTVRLLFQARDSSGNPQPITTAPVVTLNPNYPGKAGNFVMFGTGQFLTSADLSSTQTQTAYGVWDKGGTTPYTRTNLQSQTLAIVTPATSGLPQNILTDTTNAVNFASKVGWYDDLPTPGQRIMTDPLLLNGNFLTTLNTPPASACGVQPQALLLEINYKTGGAPTQPILDINGNGAFNTYAGGNAAGIAIGPGYASSPTIIFTGGTGAGMAGGTQGTSGTNTTWTYPGAHGGSYTYTCKSGSTLCTCTSVAPGFCPNRGTLYKNVTLSSGAQVTILNKSGNKITSSWWQVQ
ncbi:MAG: pilus assembly protein PilY [Candidimonas sp.]|nr:MAG: pilus assembly protein PilY [Candidimonas sp.]TAM17155.1 MAG: pilus assembly protein PilY [Candidimonas sp.]